MLLGSNRAVRDPEQLVAAVNDSVCVRLLPSFASGGASLCSCTEDFPVPGYQPPPAPLRSCWLPQGVFRGNTCRLQSDFLIQLLCIHPVHTASCRAVGSRHSLCRGVWKLLVGLTRTVVFFFLRILSYNNLTRLDEGSLADLGGLHVLRLSHNSINHIAEGAFKGLKNLRVL